MTRTVILILILAASPRLFAQQASSFEHVELLVSEGDEVQVATADGKITKGKIWALAPSVLSLRVDGFIRDFRDRDILEIRQRRDDSLRNGAKIGAWMGLGLGILGSLAACHETRGSQCAAAALPITAVYVGMGAAIGAGIDALNTRTVPIYSSRKGAALSFRF